MEVVTDPGGWWIAPFVEHSFMRDALAAALLAAFATAVVGTWVVLRGLSFLGDALAHGVLPGVAIAFVLDVHPTWGAMVAALAMVGALNVLRARTPFSEDISIGVLFVGFLALAVVIMSGSSGSYSGDLNRFLFGSITGVTDADLVRQAVAAAVAVLGVVVMYRGLLVSTFDEDHARLSGFGPRAIHGGLVTLIAVAIVASFETVGNLLVFSFLVAPPATAALLVRRVPIITLVAAGIGSACAVLGLLISFHFDTAAGATMALVTVIVFLITVMARPSAGSMPRR